MDGNGRWAENQNLLRFEGHRAGAESVRTVIRCCLKKGIPILSLFAFSSENWQRPVEEVEFLMKLFLQSLQDEVTLLKENGVRLCFIGCRKGLSPLLQKQMEQAEALTHDNNQLCLNIVINYGGRWDITNALQIICQKVLNHELALEDITEQALQDHLCLKDLPDPDLFIRTSGEQRISNFFLWHLAYTELYFTPAHWPDFNEIEFEKAIASFQKRERRYGKTSHQLNENVDV